MEAVLAGKRKFFVEKDLLESLYQDMTLLQIADYFGVGETLIHTRIKEFGIKLGGRDLGHRRRPREFTPEHLAALRRAAKLRRGKYVGPANPHWKGGRTAIHLHIRGTAEYKDWKLSALARAGNKCQLCGANRGAVCSCCGHRVVLHVHHAKSFAKHEELRFDPTNSEVLCDKCHRSRHFGKIG